MAPTSTRERRRSGKKEIRNVEELLDDLEACGYIVRQQKSRYQITHEFRPGMCYVPNLLSDNLLDAQINRLRTTLGFDPDEAKRKREDDRQERLERGKRVPPTPAAPVFVPPVAEPVGLPLAVHEAPSTVASVASSAEQTLYDKLYERAQQIGGGKARVIRVDIDADMARQLLGLNEFWVPPAKRTKQSFVRSNRSVKPGTVKSYADDMANGLWRVSDLAIAFDWDGKLLNGQHRLLGVQLANKLKPGITVTFYVWFDVDPDAWDAYDMGTNRSFTDLAGADGKKNLLLLGATSRLVMRYDADKDWRLKISPVAQRDWTNDPVNAAIDDAVRAASTVRQSNTVKLVASSLGALAFLVMRNMPDRRDGLKSDPLYLFLEGVRRGEGVHRGDPRYAIREWSNRKLDSEEKTNWYQLALLIKCYNRFLTGTSVQQPNFRQYNEEFPELLKVWDPFHRAAFAKRHRIQA